MSTGQLERTRTFTWEDPAENAAAGLQMAGLDYILAIADGRMPPPPIARLMDFTIAAAERGRAVFTVVPAEWMCNPLGGVHGGVAATILDSCMGCAVHTTLPAGVGFATSDLQVRYVRPITTDHGRILAEGTVLNVGRRTAIAEGRLYTEDGERLLAHAMTGLRRFVCGEDSKSGR